MTKSRKRIYWIAFCLGIAIAFVAAAGLTPHGGAPKLRFPDLSEVFVGTYYTRVAEHSIVYHGLFGFSKKIKNADIVIVGNSHPQFGISAQMMSDRMSAFVGRKIRVVNIAVGWGEPFSFSAASLRHNDAKCKIVIMDMFNTFHPTRSKFGNFAIEENLLKAYARVFDAWLITGRDWLLDGHFPKFRYESGRFIRSRFLASPIVSRRWDGGDVDSFWYPEWGNVFSQITPSLREYWQQIPLAGPAPIDVESARQTFSQSNFAARNLQFVWTLVPFEGAQPSNFAVIAAKFDMPFISINAEGIDYIDRAHVTETGRAIVTTRLIEGLQDLIVKNRIVLSSHGQCTDK